MTFLRRLLLRREDVGDDDDDEANDVDAAISGGEDEHAGAQSGGGDVDDDDGSVADDVAERVLDERMRVALSVGLSLSRALGAESEVRKFSRACKLVIAGDSERRRETEP